MALKVIINVSGGLLSMLFRPFPSVARRLLLLLHQGMRELSADILVVVFGFDPSLIEVFPTALQNHLG